MSVFIDGLMNAQDVLTSVWDFMVQDGNPIKDFADGMDRAVDALKEVTREEEVQDKEGTFLGVKLFDDDFWKLIFRFALNMTFLLVIVRLIYYPIAKRKDYLFTYIMISILVFFICFTLKKFDLGLGMALGLFAIFGIIRYRTDPIPIKEMTYLFIIIGVSVINALSNRKMSYVELAFTNLLIVFATYGLEKLWLLKHETRKNVVYENIELIKPEKHDELMADLKARTGLNINRIEIGRIDFLRDTAVIRIFYFEDEQNRNAEEAYSSDN